MQLAYPRKGWENEHLAAFLISRIAFLASPTKVGDDAGTDIFCTLFDVRDHKGQPALFPRRSIAVQLKSDRASINVASSIEYLEALEVPYYVGVVDRDVLSLELFSARFLPALFSLKGHHSALLLKLVDEFDREYRPKDKDGNYSLLCHKVATLTAHDDPAAVALAAAAIRADAELALQAIVSRRNQEYLFPMPDGTMEVYAGVDSAQTFRHAFFKRLAEAYFNLSWLIDTNQPASEAEMDAFETISDELGKVSVIPGWVLNLRAGLQQRRRSRRRNAVSPTA